jgi:hypothetical protein
MLSFTWVEVHASEKWGLLSKGTGVVQQEKLRHRSISTCVQGLAGVLRACQRARLASGL